MPNEAAVPIRGFSGLNLREPAGLISDNELSNCENYDLGRAGELVKRKGFTTIAGQTAMGINNIRLLGHFKTATYSQLLAVANSNFYYSNDGITWTLNNNAGSPWGDIRYGVQYNDTFALVRANSTVLTWNGTAMTAVSGSPSGTWCIIHKERLFVANTTASGNLRNRLYFSGVADLTSWPGTNFIDIRPGDGDYIVGGEIIEDILVLFKSMSSWTLAVRGTPANWVRRNLDQEIGCTSPYSIKQIEGIIYFVGPKGIYRTDSNVIREIAPGLNNLFEGRVVTPAEANLDSAALWEDKYIVSVQLKYGLDLTWTQAASYTWGNWGGQSGLAAWSSTVNRIFVYHLKQKGWTEYVVATDWKPWTFIEVRTQNPNYGLYVGNISVNGKVYRFGNTVYQDDGSNYSARFSTKEFDFDHADKIKRVKWLSVEQTGAGVVSYSSTVDGTDYPSNITGVSTRRAYKIPGPGYCRTFKFNGTVATENPHTFFGSVAHIHRKGSLVGAK